MSIQTTVKDFFKPRLNTMSSGKKKFNLSLNKASPTKIPKLNQDKSISDVINLDSDDEHYLSEPFNDSKVENISISSESTVIYSPDTPRKSSNNPQFQTSAGSENSLSPRSVSGTPKNKFYSPTKKRTTTVRRSTNVRKNLINSLPAENSYEDDSVKKEFKDKTNFTVDIIIKFLNDASLTSLLTEKSVKLLNDFVLQNMCCLKLVCNLYGRKSRWFRWDEIKSIISKNNKCDDASCHQMLTSLLQCDTIVASNYQGHNQCLSFDEYVNVLKKDEIFAICKKYKLKPTSKKNCIDLLKVFSKQKNISSYLTGTHTSSNEKRVLQSLREKMGPCFKLSQVMQTTLHELYILMYLGMDYDIIKDKKLELTIINDKAGIQTFPYRGARTDNASVVFKTREEFERYLTALSVYNEYYSITGLTKHCECISKIYRMYKDIDDHSMKRYSAMPAWLHKFTPPNIFIKILEDGIKFLKQDKSQETITLAIDILSMLIAQTRFRQHRKLEWYAEKALILDKIESKSDEAALVLLEGLNLEHQDEAKDVLRKRASLLAKRKTNSISPEAQIRLLKHSEVNERLEIQFDSKHIYKTPMESSRGGKIMFETRNVNGEVLVQDAEDFCLSHYLQSGEYTQGGHWEGRIITTIFFLLLWDEIYCQEILVPLVPGLVLCQYQQYPLDLHGEGFYHNRKKLLEDRLAVIKRYSTEQLLNQMELVWDARPACELSGINRGIPYELVSGTAACIGAAGVAAICRRLAMCYGHAQSGFPDLTLFNCHTKKILFVEVKTDSDRPSMRQLQWMQFLRDQNLPVQFCYVGTDTTRCQNRRVS